MRPSFDAVIKLLIQESAESLRQLELDGVREWLNVELPRTQSRRVDLLGRKKAGGLVHVELQNTNDNSMAFRMAEYALAIQRRYGRYPEQLVLYLGNEPLRMKPEFRTRGMVCKFRQVDIRELDGNALLASERISDQILAVLAGLDHPKGAIHNIFDNILRLDTPNCEPALQKLLLTCELRGLENEATSELETMPLTIEISPTGYIGKLMRKSREEGLEQGLEQASKALVRRMLVKRFGKLTRTYAARFDQLSAAQAEVLLESSYTASSLKELFDSLT